MTRALSRMSNLATRKIVSRERQIQDHKKCQREQMHFEKVERTIIRKNVEQCFRFRFVKKKAVIEAGELVRRQRDNEIELRPSEDTNDGKGAWPQMMRQH